MTLDRVDGLPCSEDGGASADTRILDRSAVPMSDLAVVQEQQHRHRLAGLTDAPVFGGRGPPTVREPVVYRACANRSLVVRKESRANGDGHDVGDDHGNSRAVGWRDGYATRSQPGSPGGFWFVAHTLAISPAVAMSKRCCMRSKDASCCCLSSLATQSTAITT